MIDNAICLPDLVRDSRLVTKFENGITKHTYRFSDPDSNRRVRNAQVRWQRERKIGEGGFGSVHVERRLSGPKMNQPKVRAVKRIGHAKHHNFIDELVAAAKFSHPQVSSTMCSNQV
jgi:calcium/calmodulin-dependent protein kinase I